MLGTFGYPEGAIHLGRAVPELKGNTEKVARAVEKQVNFGALRSAGPIQESSADNLVPREPGSTMPGYHRYMVSNGIMDGKGYNPVPTLVPKYSSAHASKRTEI